MGGRLAPEARVAGSRRPGLLGLALLASAALLLSREVQAGDPLGAIRRAFLESDAGLLRPALAAHRKVYLDLPCVHAEAAFLGSDQVYYLFQSFFARNHTRSFTAAPGEERELRIEARADWTYEDPGGEKRSAPLLLTLVEEDGAWVVIEIRSARA